MRNLILKTKTEVITITYNTNRIITPYKAVWQDGFSEHWSEEHLIKLLMQDAISINWE